MPEMAHDWLNKSILFSSILFCGQHFQTKIKISKFLVKKHVFMQNSKISGIPSLHHFIPAVVIIIEK